MNQIANVDWKSMPRDLAMVRMENETMQAMAIAKPRNDKELMDRLTSQIKAYPAFARVVIYNKPVGRKPDVCARCGVNCRRDKYKQIATECWKCHHDKIIEGEMQFAKGLSIRAAEALAEIYGFNRVNADVEPLGDDRVKITATFTDFATGRVWGDSRFVSKSYKGADGRMQYHSDDRFFNIVIPAEKSKLIREVVTRCIPPGLRFELQEKAEEALTKLLDEKTIVKIIDKYGTKGVTLQMLERFLGAKKEKWTQEHRSACGTLRRKVKPRSPNSSSMIMTTSMMSNHR
jgi:hypothetical protein